VCVSVLFSKGSVESGDVSGGSAFTPIFPPSLYLFIFIFSKTVKMKPHH